MTISKMLHAASAAIAGFSIATALTIGAVAQTDSRQVAKNVVLVHGAWADGSSWDKVIPLLETKGLHVVAVQLSLTSLDNDVATVKRALALQDRPVVLVGHSTQERFRLCHETLQLGQPAQGTRKSFSRHKE